MGILVEIGGRYKLWELPVVCPLQALEANNTQTLYSAFLESMRIAGLEQFLNVFPHRFVLLTMDLGSANETAFQCLRQLAFRHCMCFRTGCEAHRISTVTSKAYGAVDGCISGVLAVSLALRTGGHFSSFRRVMQDIVLASLDVVDGVPPRANTPHIIRRDALLKLCITGSESASERAKTV